MSDHGLFSSYEGLQGAATGKDLWGFFRDAQSFGRLDASSRADFTTAAQSLHHHGPRYFNFSHVCTICGLEKLGLVGQNRLERDLSVLLLRTLAVGRRQQSESIEIALDME